MTAMGPEPGLRLITVKDLVHRCRIGVTDQERQAPQPVRVRVELLVTEEPVVDEDVTSVVDYTWIVGRIHDALEGPPLRLVESMAERIAAACLADPRIRRCRVALVKPEAVPEAEVAVEIERRAAAV